MKLGPYEIVCEVGRGGMGVVLRARSPGGADLAIKVLLKPDAERLARFERERRLLSALGETEGFVSLLDAGDSPQGHYLVMPFVSGGTLRTRLEQGPLGVEETLKVGRAVASAAGEAHRRGIVHRDLKPENVLFTGDGRPLVADLGLAKHFGRGDAGAAASVSLSKTNDFRGTVGYMPAEQMEDARSACPPADVFALGAILYECLAGEPAFSAPTLIALSQRVAEGKPQPLSRLRPDAPAWLVAAIERAMARDPERRFANGAALEAALHAPPSGTGSRSRAATVALVTVAVAVATLLAVFARKPVPDPVAAPAPTVAALDSRAEATRLVDRAAQETEALQIFAAIETAKRAIALDPSLAPAWVAKGAAEVARRDFEAARPDLDRALELDARSARAWFLRGCARHGAGDRDGALADLAKALDLDGRHVLALVERARLRIEQGDSEAADRDVAKALAVAPRAPAALGMRGLGRLLTGDARAGDDLSLAISIDARGLRLLPDDREFLGFSAWGGTLENLIELCVRQRPSEGWALALHSCVNEAPSSPRAIAEAERSVELAPGLAVAWYARARAKHARNDHKRALEDVAKALELDPGFAPAWVERARLHFASGDRAGAHRDLDRAIELDARDHEAWRLRAFARSDEGDFEAALTASKHALEFARGNDDEMRALQALIASRRSPPALTAPSIVSNAAGTTITWDEAGRGSQGFVVDIDDDGNWSNGFWHKSISSGTTTTDAPSGFQNYGGSSGPLTLTAGVTYTVRVYYPATQERSPEATFVAAAPPPTVPPAYTPTPGGDRLPSDGRLEAGQSLVSPDGRYQAVMQGDGNFVLYDSSGKALWVSGNHSGDASVAIMQGDGNLVVYRVADGSARWNSQTNGQGPSTLVLENNGSLVVYRLSDWKPIWTSGTAR